MTSNGIKCTNRCNTRTTRGLQSSVTIEAAMSLPIFIFTILSFAFFIMVLRTQEMVQDCLISAADSMAVQYYTTADLAKVYQNSGNVTTDITNSSDMYDFYNTLEKYNTETSLNSYFIFGPSMKTDRVDPVDLKAYIQNVWHMYEYIYTENNLQPMSYHNGVSLYKDYLLSEFYKRSFDITNQYDSMSMSAATRKSAVDTLLKKYNIFNGFSGIEFSGVNATGTWDSEFDPQNNDGLITIKVKYEIKIPFPMQTLGKIPMTQAVCVRMWGKGD